MILFMYDWIPNFIYQIIFAIGLIGTPIFTIFPTLPFIGQYQLAAKWVSIICLIVGLVWFGVDESETRWKARNALAEQKITELENRAPIITEKIVTEYVYDTKIIKQKGENLVIKVPYYITKEADIKCSVPAGFVRLYNRAADSGLSDTTSGVDATGTKAAEKASGTASGPK